MHHDSLLNGHIGVGLSSRAALILGVQLVELHLDLGTTGKLASLGLVSSDLSPCIILTCDLILISLHKLSYHIPQKMLLLAILRGKRWSKVNQVCLGLTELHSDILNNSGQVVLNMGK